MLEADREVMTKGKGIGPRFRSACNGVTTVTRPVITRLTRMMAFVELPHSLCTPSLTDAPDEEADPAGGRVAR